jgi:hypothetical protein
LQLPDVLVADANVLLSALIGGRAADALIALGPAHVRAAVDVGNEVTRWLPKLAAKRHLDLNVLLAEMRVLPVQARSVAVWSQDKDFEVCGLPRLTTGQVLRALGS